MAEVKITYNPCQGTMCHEACILTTIVKDGRILRTERMVHPKTGESMGEICQRGIECTKLPYLESRIKFPLKRVGERGEGKFERISWEKAMDEVGEKLNQIKDKYGPQSVLVYNYPCGVANWTGAQNMLLPFRFVNTFGATMLPWPPVDMFGVHSYQVCFGDCFGYIGYDVRLFSKAKLIIIWGGNPIGFTRAAHTSRFLLEAQENGAKIIDIGVLFDSSAAKADKFIPINPGTDGALALAMANVMLRDNIWNQDFMTLYTVAPFLVRDDNGMFLRESDIIKEGKPENYVFWNKVPLGPHPISPHQKITASANPDLFAEVVVNGIPCKTAMVHIQNLVKPWTPEAQAKITGIPASTVEQITHDYSETQDALIYQYCGARYLNAGFSGRAIMLVAALSGQMLNDVGGFTFEASFGGEHPVGMNSPAVMVPDGDPKNIKGKYPLYLSDMIKKGFPYKALLNVLGNPVQNWPNRDLWAKQIYPKLELIVAYEYRMSDTARFADYVFPDTTPFERQEVVAPKAGYMIYCEPAINPIGEARPVADFFRELASRVGILEHFDKTTEQWNQVLIQTPDPAIATLDPPLSWEHLQKEKMVKLNVPDYEFNVWRDMDFPTESGKIELYSDQLADVGAALPKYVETLIQGSERKQFPLQLLVYRSRVFMQTQFSDFPDLLQLEGQKPILEMNATDAYSRKISNGERVEVFNNRGSFRCQVKVTNKFPPGILKVLFSYPAHKWDGDPPQALMNPMGTPEMDDPVINKWVNIMQNWDCPELNINTQIGDGWENLWDTLVDIRKVEGGK